MWARIILLILILLPVFASAQKDTLYFKEIKQQVYNIQEADYYRLPYIPEVDRYKVLDYYTNGTLKTEGYTRTYDTLIWDGPYVSYHDNGHKMETGNYINGHKIANWKQYQDDGKLWVLTSYNLLSDTAEILRSFYKSGKVKRIEYRVKDKDPKGVCYSEDGAAIKYTPFEQMPEFQEEISRFLSQTVRYPDAAVIHDLDGRVFVRFTINEDGKVDNVEVVNPAIDPALMLEAIRAVKLMNGKWKPGKQDDKPVKVYFTLPISFTLY